MGNGEIFPFDYPERKEESCVSLTTFDYENF